MKIKTPCVGDIGRTGAQTWAQDFAQRHGRIEHGPSLRLIQMDDRNAIDSENGYLRRAMAAIDFELFVSAIVYFRVDGSADRKCREIQNIIGAKLSRRTYWNNLDRLWYFMAGRMIERPLLALQSNGNSLPTAAQRYNGSEPVVLNPAT